MQNWTMIPMHIRCTERYKIDPHYPDDDAKWWISEERKSSDLFGSGNTQSGQTPDQVALLNFIDDNGEVTTHDIRRQFGWRFERTRCIVMGLSFNHPIYEQSGGATTYGLLA